jgi:HAD superfamily hydrolase (TIGR01549 family)
MTNKTDTVIFDLDGTLVDSQPAALGATIEALSQFGVQVTAAEVREVFGGGARKLLGHFLERDLSAGQADQVLEAAVRLRAGLQLELISETLLLPGVKDLMASLKDGEYTLAVATMSSRAVVDSVLEFHGIGPYFDVVLTIDDVTKGKPDPEILIKAVDRLGGQVSSALYVGDSSHDLEAALNLGMPFLLVDSGLYVRGEARNKLHAAAEQNGFPIVGMEELLDIAEIIQRRN